MFCHQPGVKSALVLHHFVWKNVHTIHFRIGPTFYDSLLTILIGREYHTKHPSKYWSNSYSWFHYYQLITSKDQQHKVKINMHKVNSNVGVLLFFVCTVANKVDVPVYWPPIKVHYGIYVIHTLHVHYRHAAANLNSGYSKYAKVAHMHYFYTIALRTSRAVLTWAWASCRVDLFSKRVILFCLQYLNDL